MRKPLTKYCKWNLSIHKKGNISQPSTIFLFQEWKADLTLGN